MSLQPQVIYLVPQETARVAHAIFPTGNLVMRMYDDLDMLFHDRDFAEIFPPQGQPAEAPTRLALVTLLQFMEGLTDRQAADAVRTRLDWKYLLCLDLTDRGFDHSVLSEFRTRLLTHQAERCLFDAILDVARERGMLASGGRQRSDSTHILGAMRTLTRLEGVTETVRHTLNVLAPFAPEWLRAHTDATWIERYGPRASEYRLPKAQAKRRTWALQTGNDALALLTALDEQMTPPELRQLPAVVTLRKVWEQNFQLNDGQVVWRETEELPPTGQFINSPYDPEARYATKRTTTWTGYKIHITETCEPDMPNLITNIETTTAAVADDAVTETIHGALAEHNLVPEVHIADTGYVNSKLFVSSQQKHGIALLGPTRSDNHWQAKEGTGFAASDFTIDWTHQQAICPEGNVSMSWTPALDRVKNEVIKIKFAGGDCRTCPSHGKCTRSTPPRRTISIRPQAQYEALQTGRAREQTAGFKTEYAKRAGVEGTIAQAVRSCEVRRSRYMGLTKTHLAHMLTGAAMNVMRMLNWLADVPKATTASSPFVQLYRSTNCP